MTNTKVVTVMNLKGGSGKTTTTAFLAHAYAKQGNSVAIIDADEQASILRWADAAGWEIPVLGKPVKKLDLLWKGLLGETRFDYVLIDTPPLDEKTGIVYGALRAANYVVTPMAPTLHEMDRLPDVWDAIESVQNSRNDYLNSSILFNRTIPNAASTEQYRRDITEAGQRVLTTIIPRREAIAQAFNHGITRLYGHDQVAIELEKESN
jgi:chromosome partitioning protein